MNPNSLVLTAVRNLSTSFSSLSYSSFDGGTLFATTGDGANPPETLFSLDPNTGEETLLTALGNGNDGEVVAWNPTDSLLYHFSGNGNAVFESINPSNGYAVAPIVGNLGTGEVFGAVFNPFSGDLLISDIRSKLSHLSVSGVVTPIAGSTLPDDLRGICFTTRAIRQNILPKRGPAAGGTVVRLRGWNVGAQASQVTVDGANVPALIIDETTVELTMPAHAVGEVEVKVGAALNTGASVYTYTFE